MDSKKTYVEPTLEKRETLVEVVQGTEPAISSTPIP